MRPAPVGRRAQAHGGRSVLRIVARRGYGGSEEGVVGQVVVHELSHGAQHEHGVHAHRRHHGGDGGSATVGHLALTARLLLGGLLSSCHAQLGEQRLDVHACRHLRLDRLLVDGHGAGAAVTSGIRQPWRVPASRVTHVLVVVAVAGIGRLLVLAPTRVVVAAVLVAATLVPRPVLAVGALGARFGGFVGDDGVAADVEHLSQVAGLLARREAHEQAVARLRVLRALEQQQDGDGEQVGRGGSGSGVEGGAE